jgi:hypothetical protein
MRAKDSDHSEGDPSPTAEAAQQFEVKAPKRLIAVSWG